MSKAKARDPDIAEEYDFSRAKRGVYLDRVSRDARIHFVGDEEDKARQTRLAKRPAKG